LRREDQLLLLEAAFGLAMARLALAVRPFPRIARRLGHVATAAEGHRAAYASDLRTTPDEYPHQVRWAIDCAVRNVPFTAVCLPQAITAQKMLGRRGFGSVLFIGGRHDSDGEMITHAWLISDSVEITGYRESAAFVPVQCFISPPQTPKTQMSL
jgi:hypothetical protein